VENVGEGCLLHAVTDSHELVARRLNRRDRSNRVAPYERYRRHRPGAVLADRWSQAWLTNVLCVLPYRLPPVAASRLIVGTGAARRTYA